MNSVLNQNIVLVLNRNWQAINITSPAQAFCQMATDVATALDIQGGETMLPTKWEDWVNLSIREGDNLIRTSSHAIRVPTVIVLANYTRVPMKRPRFSARNVRERDDSRCQYTGQKINGDEGNIDHIIPRSRGGKTSWTNCVWASRKINTKKADRTPTEAGLKLVQQPDEPRQVPVTVMLKNIHGIADWNPFLFN